MIKSFLEQFANEIPIIDEISMKKKYYNVQKQMNVNLDNNCDFYFLTNKTACTTKKIKGGGGTVSGDRREGR